MTMRRTLPALALAAALAVVSACAPTVPTTPPTATQVSPASDDGYIHPEISGDGTVVIYRREADQYAGVETPRDLVVTRLATQSTNVIPSIRTVRALSADGRYLVHGYAPTWRADTSTGAQVQLRTGTNASLGDIAISGDGSTIAWNEMHYTAGNCPCQRRLHVWRNGSEVLNTLLEDGGGIYTPDLFRDEVAINSTGTTAYVHRHTSRQIIRFDVTTGASSVVPLQFPVIGDLGTFGDLASFLRWTEWLEWSSADGTAFRMTSGDDVYLISAGPPVLLPEAGDLSTWAMSPNGRWYAFLSEAPVRPGVIHQTYSVTDRSTGTTRKIVSADVGVPVGVEPLRSFNGTPSVADDGSAVYGWWYAPIVGTWQPSAIYLDR